MNAELCTIEKLFVSIETCHICGGQLALDDVEPTHCENCSGDCEDHEDDACVPLYELLREARQALRSLRQRRSQQLKLMEAFVLLEKQMQQPRRLGIMRITLQYTGTDFAVTAIGPSNPSMVTHQSKTLIDAVTGVLNV